MATTNPFDLLGDDDNDDDPSQVASHLLKLAPAKKSSAPPPQVASAQQAKPAKLPLKPLPPAQAGLLLTREKYYGMSGVGKRYDIEPATNPIAIPTSDMKIQGCKRFTLPLGVSLSIIFRAGALHHTGF